MEKLLTSVYKNRTLCSFLKILSHLVSILCILTLAFNLGYFVYLEAYREAAKLATSLLIGYIFVTGVREIIDAPRPYELFEFYKHKPKKREGRSFPSRHAYSAFAISSAALSVNIPLGISLLLASLVMCAARVLLGIHFIRDVVAGALIGVTAGVGALLII